MRPDLRHVLMKRIKEDHGYDNRSDYADYGDYGDMARGGRRDRADMRDMKSDFRDMEDQRRGVRGSGRRRRDRADEMYYDDDEDYDKPFRLPRKVKMMWKHNLINKDGTKGPHFSDEELYPIIEKMRLSFDNYTESDVCLMANVIYSDFCDTLKHVIQPEKQAYYYVSLAKDFLEDDDALEGSDKVTAYYYCVANG